MGDAADGPPLDERVQRLLADAVRRVRYGTISITIHEGAVTDVAVTEKTRIPPAK